MGVMIIQAGHVSTTSSYSSAIHSQGHSVPFHRRLRITSLRGFRSSTTALTRSERRVEAIVSLSGFRSEGSSAPSGTLRRHLRAA